MQTPSTFEEKLILGMYVCSCCANVWMYVSPNLAVRREESGQIGELVD